MGEAGLAAAGLVKRKARRGVHRKRRERRPLPGMMLHIDGSDHQWFQDERRHDLIVILDDATSEIYYAQLAEEETTATVMAGLRAVIERKGCSVRSIPTAEPISGTHRRAVARSIMSALHRWAVP